MPFLLRQRDRELVLVLFLWRKVAARFSILSSVVALALAIGAVASGVVLPTLLRAAGLSFIFPDFVLIKPFADVS